MNPRVLALVSLLTIQPVFASEHINSESCVCTKKGSPEGICCKQPGDIKREDDEENHDEMAALQASIVQLSHSRSVHAGRDLFLPNALSHPSSQQIDARLRITVAAVCLALIFLIVLAREFMLLFCIGGPQQLQPSHLTRMKLAEAARCLNDSMDYAYLIPISFDLALAFGWGATASGFLVSCIALGTVIGSMLSQKVISGMGHKKKRLILVFAAMLTAVCEGGIAVSMSVLDLETKTQIWFGLLFILTRIMAGIAIGIGGTHTLIVFNVCPLDGVPSLEMLMTVFFSAGSALGPLMTFCVLDYIRQWYQLDPVESAAAPMLFQSIVWASVALLMSISLPKDLDWLTLEQNTRMANAGQGLPGDITAPSAGAISGTIDDDILTQPAENVFSDGQRQLVNVHYVIEAVLASAAAVGVELVTSFILQVEYNWSATDISFGVAVVFGFNCITTCLLTILRHFSGTQMDLSLGLILCSAGLGGACLYFKYQHSGLVAQLFMADALICPGITSKLAMVFGYAMWAADTEKWYGPDFILQVMSVGENFTRFIVSAAGRGIVATFGRNAYAYYQMSLIAMLVANFAILKLVSMKIHLSPNHLAELLQRHRSKSEGHSDK